MRVRKALRISAVAMLALVAAGCGTGDSGNDMSTDVNLTDDAAADDVLGANNIAENDTRSP